MVSLVGMNSMSLKLASQCTTKINFQLNLNLMKSQHYVSIKSARQECQLRLNFLFFKYMLYRSLAHKSRQHVISTTINQYDNLRWDNEKPFAHVWGSLEGKVGRMYINRGHKNNLMTPVLIQEIKRFLKSYEMDDHIELVWCQSSHSEVFSKGTDFRYLMGLIAQKKDEEAQQYLQQVQDIARTFASFSKPWLTHVRGDMAGVGAALAAQAPFTMTEGEVKWWMNEAKYGFIPHGGASYVLSRLPHEYGPFIALTGQVLNKSDLVALGMAKYDLLSQYDDLKGDLAVSIFDEAHPGHTHTMYGNMFQWDKHQMRKGQAEYFKAVEREINQRIFNKDPELQEDPRLVMAEVLYKNELVKDANIRKYLDDERKKTVYQKIHNYTSHFEKEIFETLVGLGHLDKPSVLRTSFHHEGIARCFSANSIEEIYERLKAENSDWANDVIERMQKRSPLSLKLTLELIRKAEISTYTECLKLEYYATSRLMKHADFKEGVENLRTGTPNFKGKLQDISRGEVQSYFEPAPYNPEIVDNAFHPVRDFYVDIPDNVRLFLNEETCYGDLQRRAGQEVDVYSYLKNGNFRVDDKTIETAEIRRILMNLSEKQRIARLKLSKIFDMCDSLENLSRYFETRAHYLSSKFREEPDRIKELIQRSVDQHFEAKFRERMAAYEHVAATKLQKDKADFFSDVRNILLNNSLSSHQDSAGWKGVNRMLFFPSDDKIGFHDTYNQSLEDTTLFKRLYAKLQNQKTDVKGEGLLDYERYHIMGVSNPKYDGFNRLHKSFDTVFGNPLQIQNLNAYADVIIKAGSRTENIRKFIDKVGQGRAKQLVLENKKITEEFLTNQIAEIAQRLEQGAQDEAKIDFQVKSEAIENYKKLLEEESFESKLKKLIEGPKQDNRLGLKLKNFIESDQQLNAFFEPLYKEQLPGNLEPIQRKYIKLLESIYAAKHKQLQFNHKSESVLDQALVESIEQDLNKLIESHVFFTFAHLLLKDLEGLYESFSQAKESRQDKLAQVEADIKSYFGVKINKEQLPKLIDFLNGLATLGTTLYQVYRESLHFSSDVALNTLIQWKQKRNIDQGNLLKNTLYTQKVLKSTGWSKNTLMHYIENQSAGFNDAMSNRIRQQLSNDERVEPDLYKYHTDIYERRALRLLRNIQPKKLKDFIPGIYGYLFRIDLSTAKAQRNDEQITPERILECLDGLEAIPEVRLFTSNLSLEEWLQHKVSETVKELFNYRRQFETTLSTDELLQLDQDFAQLLQPQQFKELVLRSIDWDMQQLQEISHEYQVAHGRAREQEIEAIRPKRENLPEYKNVPLVMTALTMPHTFDKSTEQFQRVPSGTLLELETQHDPHPLRKEAVKVQKLGTKLEEMNIRKRKLRKELGDKLNPLLVTMQEQDAMNVDIQNELKMVADRIRSTKM